jgi:flagellar biosynthesis/type III secretory pathway M-ring protein FliF/YscJ
MAAGGGALVMLLLVLMMRRRRRKKERAAALVLGDAGGRKSRKKAKSAPVAETTALPIAARPASATNASDPDRLAVDEIKGDLERMLNESPESLAALLSAWMAK